MVVLSGSCGSTSVDRDLYRWLRNSTWASVAAVTVSPFKRPLAARPFTGKLPRHEVFDLQHEPTFPSLNLEAYAIVLSLCANSPATVHGPIVSAG